MTAYSKTELLRTSRERERRLKNRRRFLGSLLICILVGGFLTLLNLNFFRLTSFKLSGETSQDLVIIKQLIKQELDGYFLLIIPNNSIFFFSEQRLIDLLKKRFPALETVEIDSPDLNTLVIKLTDRESKTLWCSLSAEGKLCFYLNDNGEVYQTAPNFSSSIILEFNDRQPIKKIPLSVINPKDLERAKIFLNFIKISLVDWPTASSSYRLVRVNVLPMADFEAIINSETNPDDTWRLLFNTRATADQLIINFNSLIKDQTLTKEWLNSPSLDYLDLRFGNKVFYRFK